MPACSTSCSSGSPSSPQREEREPYRDDIRCGSVSRLGTRAPQGVFGSERARPLDCPEECSGKYTLDFLGRLTRSGRCSVDSRDCVGLVGRGGDGQAGVGEASPRSNRRRARASRSHASSAPIGDRDGGGDVPTLGLHPPSQYISQSINSSSRSNAGFCGTDGKNESLSNKVSHIEVEV